jgi:hypothetical protein
MSEFQCPYAPKGDRRCPPSICDCFIDQFPHDPFGLHPEAFIVGSKLKESAPNE